MEETKKLTPIEEFVNNVPSTLGAAICLAQAELKNPIKDTEGYGYDYADLAGIIDNVKPVLKKYGLSVIQFPVSSDEGVGVRTVLMHVSGEKLEDIYHLPIPEIGKANKAQAAGAAITYARRYALSAVLNISADDDTDASSTEPAKKTEPASDPAKQWKVEKTEVVCPKCGKGQILHITNLVNGESFYGCSEKKNGCTYKSQGLPEQPNNNAAPF